jgi:hypothetical protein
MALLSFRRVEKKYIVNEEQKRALLDILLQHMELDKFCVGEKTYTIQNVYYDTEDDLLIRKSIQKPMYKEKIRARKYTGMNNYFLEVKKKYDGVVGKRRITLTKEELDNFVYNNIPPIREKFSEKQAIKEIGYVLKRYKLKPKVFLSYERLALFDKIDKELRITFDDKIHTNRTHPEFDREDYERDLLPPGMYVLEIKYVSNYPLWLAKAINDLKLKRVSYSKYGTEFKLYFNENKPININK